MTCQSAEGCVTCHLVRAEQHTSQSKVYFVKIQSHNVNVILVQVDIDTDMATVHSL